MKNVCMAVVCVLLVVCVMGNISYGCDNGRLISLDKDIADDVLRFHIIANSDDKEDQKLKIAVRDAVAKEVANDLRAQNINDKINAQEYVQNNMNKYVNEAYKVIRDNGYSYSVTGMVGRWWFPVKIYGSYIFPEGEYDAVRLMIGKAEGKNWWCVLFPSLCIVDDAYQVMPDDEEDEGENVKIKLRVVEWIKDMW